MKKHYFTAQEIISFGLGALPATESGIARLAQRNRWKEKTVLGMPLANQKPCGKWRFHWLLVAAEFCMPTMPSWRIAR